MGNASPKTGTDDQAPAENGAMQQGFVPHRLPYYAHQCTTDSRKSSEICANDYAKTLTFPKKIDAL
jgi:hypothetical protein